MNIVIVFTSKPLETMIVEGGSGHWSANRKRLEGCSYLVATKSNTLREHFPSNTNIEQGAAFLIGRISNIANAPASESGRLVIQISEYAEVNIPEVWTGNRNPVAYTDAESFQRQHRINFSELTWQRFPETELRSEIDVRPLTIEEAKKGIAKTLGIDPSCIEIQIRA